VGVRLSALCAGRLLLPGIFLLLVSVRGCVDPRAIIRLERLGQFKNLINSMRIEPDNFRFAAQCPHIVIALLLTSMFPICTFRLEGFQLNFVWMYHFFHSFYMSCSVRHHWNDLSNIRWRVIFMKLLILQRLAPCFYFLGARGNSLPSISQSIKECKLLRCNAEYSNKQRRQVAFFLLARFFYPENGGRTFLQNVTWLFPDYMMLQPTK
jgi:hypothetical protein